MRIPLTWRVLILSIMFCSADITFDSEVGVKTLKNLYAFLKIFNVGLFNVQFSLKTNPIFEEITEIYYIPAKKYT